LPRQVSGIVARHFRRHSAFIEKNQPLRRDPTDRLREGLLLLLRFGVALARVECLLLNRQRM
jgi:hypothetical protein